MLYIAISRKNSLTTSRDTGSGIVRQNYVNEYKKWHKNKITYMPLNMNKIFENRPFPIQDKVML